jgi:uncharacterized protein
MKVHRIAPAPVHKRATEYMVRMRDGVRLATDVYLPEPTDATVPGPVILVRLPYDKSGDYAFMPEIALYMTRRRYRVVVQDVRGKFRSEGETLPFINEVYDGYDTIEWITGQPWSDGTVGMWGDSYYGFTQWAAASSAHPALRAIAPRVTGMDLGALPAPANPVGDVEQTANRMYPITIFAGQDSEEFEPAHLPGRPLIEQVERYFEVRGGAPDCWPLWFPRAVPVRRFPNGHPLDAPPIPVLLTIGWYDNCAFWQWRDHERITVRPGDDHASDAGARARMLPRYLDPALEFFDVFLRGLAGPGSIPKVRWDLVHGGGLRAGHYWPPESTSGRTLFLSGAHAAAGVPPGGRLEHKAPAADIARWTHDPCRPVPSAVANPFAFLAEYPDESATGARADVLAFTAAAVTAALDLAGPVSFTAVFSSTAPSADLFARLLDVAPDGSAHLIAKGQVHARTRAGAMPVTVPMGHAGYRLHHGHRPRLHLASSDFPEYVTDPGTGEHPWLAAGGKPAQHSIRLGGPDAALLLITIME